MRELTIVRAGGAALIAGAVAFLGVFAYLAGRADGFHEQLSPAAVD